MGKNGRLNNKDENRQPAIYYITTEEDDDGPHLICDWKLYPFDGYPDPTSIDSTNNLNTTTTNSLNYKRATHNNTRALRPLPGTLCPDQEFLYHHHRAPSSLDFWSSVSDQNNNHNHSLNGTANQATKSSLGLLTVPPLVSVLLDQRHTYKNMLNSDMPSSEMLSSTTISVPAQDCSSGHSSKSSNHRTRPRKSNSLEQGCDQVVLNDFFDSYLRR